MAFCISHKNLLHAHLASLQEPERPYPAFLAVPCWGPRGKWRLLVPPSPPQLGPHLLRGQTESPAAQGCGSGILHWH